MRRLQLPRDAALVTILRGPRVIVPEADEPLEGGDELLFVAVTEAEEDLRKLLLPAGPPLGQLVADGIGLDLNDCRRPLHRPRTWHAARP